jgi:hypothetical protein
MFPLIPFVLTPRRLTGRLHHLPRRLFISCRVRSPSLALLLSFMLTFLSLSRSCYTIVRPSAALTFSPVLTSHRSLNSTPPPPSPVNPFAATSAPSPSPFSQLKCTNEWATNGRRSSLGALRWCCRRRRGCFSGLDRKFERGYVCSPSSPLHVWEGY